MLNIHDIYILICFYDILKSRNIKKGSEHKAECNIYLLYKMMKKFILNLFGKSLSLIAVSNVNSACAIIYGQEHEPKSLSRFKKYK